MLILWLTDIFGQRNMCGAEAIVYHTGMQETMQIAEDCRKCYRKVAGLRA